MTLARLLFLFLAVPLVELALLLWISQFTGWGFTLALVLITGFVGAWLTRRQGWGVWQRVARESAAGKMPAEAFLDGMMIVVAGALLITPGMITDLAGFFLLLPPGRRWVRRRIGKRLRTRFEMHVHGPEGNTSARPQQRDEIIDVQFVEPEESRGGRLTE